MLGEDWIGIRRVWVSCCMSPQWLQGIKLTALSDRPSFYCVTPGSWSTFSQVCGSWLQMIWTGIQYSRLSACFWSSLMRALKSSRFHFISPHDLQTACNTTCHLLKQASIYCNMFVSCRGEDSWSIFSCLACIPPTYSVMYCYHHSGICPQRRHAEYSPLITQASQRQREKTCVWNWSVGPRFRWRSWIITAAPNLKIHKKIITQTLLTVTTTNTY